MNIKKYNNNFDSLRLFSAFLVMFSHQFALSGLWEPRLIGDHSFGNLGVLCFFTISGYLVSISWKNDPHPFRFITRRFLRVVPGLTTSISITAISLAIMNMSDFSTNPIPEINGSLWTIPLEIYCYLILLIIGIVFVNPSLLFFGIIITVWWTSGGQNTHNFLAYFGLFFGGGVLLSYYSKLLNNQTLLGFIFLGALFLSMSQFILGLLFIVSPITIYIGKMSWPILKNAGYFGDLSYGIYIYAWPVQQYIVYWLGAESSYYELFFPSVALTLLFAYLSWHIIEKPALKYKPTILKLATNNSTTMD